MTLMLTNRGTMSKIWFTFGLCHRRYSDGAQHSPCGLNTHVFFDFTGGSMDPDPTPLPLTGTLFR